MSGFGISFFLLFIEKLRAFSSQYSAMFRFLQIQFCFLFSFSFFFESSFAMRVFISIVWVRGIQSVKVSIH